MKIIFFTSNRADIGLFKNLFSIFKKNFQIYLINLGNPKNLQEIFFYKNLKIINIYNTNFNNSLIQMTFKSQNPIIKNLINIKPDLCFIPGDRIEMLSPALCCHFLDLKIAHLHGGELTHGSKDDTTRHAISKLSHIHYVSNYKYKKRLIQLGEKSTNIFNCGSISICNLTKKKLISKKKLENEFFFKFKKFNSIISYHPTLNLNNDMKIIKNIFKLVDQHSEDLFLITSPNPDSGSKEIMDYINKNSSNYKNLFYINSFGNEKFISMLKYCDCIIGNSSSAIIEAPSFSTFSINIGDRQKGRLFSKNIINSKGSFNDINSKYLYIKSQCHRKLKFVNPYYNKNTLKIIKNSINKTKDININKFFYDQI